jgi:hypothetical protein
MVPVPASTGPPGYDVGRSFEGAHVSKEPTHGKDGPQCRRYGFSTVVEWLHAIEVLNVKVGVFMLLLFASLPNCNQNQPAVSDTLRLLYDF